MSDVRPVHRSRLELSEPTLRRLAGLPDRVRVLFAEEQDDGQLVVVFTPIPQYERTPHA